MKVRFFRGALLLLLICALFTVAALADGFAANLYDAVLFDAPEGDTLALAPAGDPVMTLDVQGDWVRVSYSGQFGWMRAILLTPLEDCDVQLGIGYVCQDGSYVTAQPEAGSAILARLETGTALAVTGVSGEYYQLGDARGNVVGYLLQTQTALKSYPRDAAQVDFVQSKTSSEAVYLGQASATEALAADLTAFAQTFLGCPYRWASMGPSSFDCSGLVGYVYSQYGYTLQRVADDIWDHDGLEIDNAADLQPGDVVCFSESGSYVGHVGIYIGDGRFIHASNRGVIISELFDGSYYEKNFHGGKRILGTL